MSRSAGTILFVLEKWSGRLDGKNGNVYSSFNSYYTDEYKQQGLDQCFESFPVVAKWCNFYQISAQ